MRTPKVDDKETAEFVGMMLGDGCIGIYKCRKSNAMFSIQHQLKISMDSREDEYTAYIVKIMKHLFGIEPKLSFKKNENAVDIRVFNKEIIHFVIKEIGLKKSPKWNRAEIPKIYFGNYLENYVLKGLFDTDGCVSITKNNGILYPRLELKICPSPMQRQIVEILKRNRFNYKVENLDKGKIRIRLNGKDEMLRWLNLIGTNNPKHLNKIMSIAEDGFEPSTYTQYAV